MIYAMHGIVPMSGTQKLTEAYMHDTESFRRFLLERTHKFVSLEAALQDRGDALTIDDSTQAAYDAALMARGLDHEVTFFINSDNVEQQVQYYLHTLSTLLENGTPEQTQRLQNFASLPEANKAALRERFKHTLTRLPSESGRRIVLEQIAQKMHAPIPSVPPHLTTLTLAKLKTLSEAGVQIENHGAMHVNFSTHTKAEERENVGTCKQWLEEHCGIDSRYFAVPFGDVLPRIKLQEINLRTWFLVTKTLHPGLVGPGIYNRINLVI